MIPGGLAAHYGALTNWSRRKLPDFAHGQMALSVDGDSDAENGENGERQRCHFERAASGHLTAVEVKAQMKANVRERGTFIQRKSEWQSRNKDVSLGRLRIFFRLHFVNYSLIAKGPAHSFVCVIMQIYGSQSRDWDGANSITLS